MGCAIGFAFRAVFQQVQLRAGFWVMVPLGIIHLTAAILGIFYTTEEWAVIVEIACLQCLDSAITIEGLAFDVFGLSENLARQASSTLLACFTISVASAVTIGGVIYDLAGWQGMSTFHAICQACLLLLFVTQPMCLLSFKEFFFPQPEELEDEEDEEITTAGFTGVLPVESTPTKKEAGPAALAAAAELPGQPEPVVEDLEVEELQDIPLPPPVPPIVETPGAGASAASAAGAGPASQGGTESGTARPKLAGLRGSMASQGGTARGSRAPRGTLMSTGGGHRGTVASTGGAARGTVVSGRGSMASFAGAARESQVSRATMLMNRASQTSWALRQSQASGVSGVARHTRGSQMSRSSVPWCKCGVFWTFSTGWKWEPPKTTSAISICLLLFLSSIGPQLSTGFLRLVLLQRQLSTSLRRQQRLAPQRGAAHRRCRPRAAAECPHGADRAHRGNAGVGGPIHHGEDQEYQGRPSKGLKAGKCLFRSGKDWKGRD